MCWFVITNSAWNVVWHISTRWGLLDLKNVPPIIIHLVHLFCLGFLNNLMPRLDLCLSRLLCYILGTFLKFILYHWLRFLSKVCFLLFTMTIYFTYYGFHFIILVLKFSFTRCTLFMCLIEFTKQSFAYSLFHKANLFMISLQIPTTSWL